MLLSYLNSGKPILLIHYAFYRPYRIQRFLFSSSPFLTKTPTFTYENLWILCPPLQTPTTPSPFSWWDYDSEVEKFSFSIFLDFISKILQGVIPKLMKDWITVCRVFFSLGPSKPHCYFIRIEPVPLFNHNKKTKYEPRIKKCQQKQTYTWRRRL